MRFQFFPAILAVIKCSSALSVPTVENRDLSSHAIEKRVAETVTKIWTLENSQIALNYAGALSALALGIAGIITATSSGSSGCTITADVVKVESRAFHDIMHYNLTAISNGLHEFGFGVKESGWSSNATAIEYVNVLTNNATSIESLAITQNNIQFRVRALDSDHSKLGSRTTTLRKNEIEVYYHASGQCYTTHTKKEVAVGIDDIISRINHNDYYASC